MRHLAVVIAVCLLVFNMVPFAVSQEPERTPIVYSTDLYQPPEDPDDHFDLAMLFALDEFDLKAIIFDISTAHRKPEEHGLSALKQIEAITKRPTPPWAIGLRYPLSSPDDTATDQPAEFQRGVELLLETLRNSEQKVVLFLVGSCRDFAAAYNREPVLMKNKVKSVYVNAGNGPSGVQNEWNVRLDPNAYRGLMASGLPIHWCPCVMNRWSIASPEEVENSRAFLTYYIVPNQAELLGAASPELKNYFVYALNRCTDEPIQFLKTEPPPPLPTSERNMWCTGPFVHASGRDIYYSRSEQKFIALTQEKAKSLGITGNRIDVFQFEPICLDFVSEALEPSLSKNDACQFIGKEADKVGQFSFEPDGILDNHIRICGLNTDKEVEKITITAPENARWESVATEKWWRVVFEKNDDQLDCFFSPFVTGRHRVTLLFKDGVKLCFECEALGKELLPILRASFGKDSSTNVFRYVNKNYNEIMCSVLSDLLQ